MVGTSPLNRILTFKLMKPEYTRPFWDSYSYPYHHSSTVRSSKRSFIQHQFKFSVGNVHGSGMSRGIQCIPGPHKQPINSPFFSGQTTTTHQCAVQALGAGSLCELLHGAATTGVALCGAQPLGRRFLGDGGVRIRDSAFRMMKFMG